MWRTESEEVKLRNAGMRKIQTCAHGHGVFRKAVAPQIGTFSTLPIGRARAYNQVSIGR